MKTGKISSNSPKDSTTDPLRRLKTAVNARSNSTEGPNARSVKSARNERIAHSVKSVHSVKSADRGHRSAMLQTTGVRNHVSKLRAPSNVRKANRILLSHP